MPEFNLPAHMVNSLCLGGFILHFLLCEELKHTLGSRRAGLHLGHGLGNLTQRRLKQTGINQKRSDHTEGNLAVYDLRSTHNTYRHITEVSDKRHQRLHQAG